MPNDIQAVLIIETDVCDTASVTDIDACFQVNGPPSFGDFQQLVDEAKCEMRALIVRMGGLL